MRQTTRHNTVYSPKEEKTTKRAKQITTRGGKGQAAAAAFFVATEGPIAESKNL